jgi:hypothetical protein
MDCPQCGEHTYRSRSSNLFESLVKYLTPLKFYRCRECGWRGIAAPVLRKPTITEWRVIAIWIIGIVFAIAIGFYGSESMQSSLIR